MKLGFVDGLQVENCLWWSQEKLFNSALMFRDCRPEVSQMGMTIALWEQGTNNLQTHLSWLRRTCASGRTVMVLNVSGEGNLQPNAISPYGIHERFGTLHKLNADLFWLDDSLAALRSYDVLRSVALAQSVEMTLQHKRENRLDVQIYAEGRCALYALIAKMLDTDNNIDKLIVQGEVGHVAKWVRSRYYDAHNVWATILPGMLKYFDVEDLIRWTGASYLH